LAFLNYFCGLWAQRGGDVDDKINYYAAINE